MAEEPTAHSIIYPVRESPPVNEPPPGSDRWAQAHDPSLLTATLDLLVPLQILDFQRHGGPTRQDTARAQTLPADLGAQGDVLLYGGGKRGDAGDLAGRLAQAIAVLAFQPGGITLFGRRWVAPLAVAPTMNTLDPTTLVITEVDQPDEDDGAILAPNPDDAPTARVPTWWVTRQGLPMTRHTQHKNIPTKTACQRSLSRYRPADAEETARLGVCCVCVPVKAQPRKGRNRG